MEKLEIEVIEYESEEVAESGCACPNFQYFLFAEVVDMEILDLEELVQDVYENAERGNGSTSGHQYV